MDWILWALTGVVLFLSLWAVVIAVVGWVATQLFGKSETWLDYGTDDDLL
jgi:hypothetical protein